MGLREETKKLCDFYNIKPVRTRGQNFLITEAVYDAVLSSAELTKEDTVLEVGPGLGFLTERLAKNCQKVIAVELDDKLAMVLGERLKECKAKNVRIINTNILDLIPEIGNWKLEIGNFKIVANLPYNITSIFLRKVYELKNKPEMMVLMLQKEVAERIAARAGQMSLLAVSVQFYAEAKIIGYVPRHNFWPEPAVDSAIIKLETRSKKPEADEKKFFQLVRIGFSSKRKMLKNNLASGYQIGVDRAVEIVKKAGFSEKIRAQELSIADWLKLFGCLG